MKKMMSIQIGYFLLENIIMVKVMVWNNDFGKMVIRWYGEWRGSR